jgi:type II secretory pathway component GspD/PulD (secretin)
MMKNILTAHTMTNNLRYSSVRRYRSALIVVLFAAVSMQQVQAQVTDATVNPKPDQATGARQDSAANKGTLNFVDADIESVIAAVGDYTNTTFIIDPRVKGTLTLVSEKPLSKVQALHLLGSVLRLRGYTIVSGSGYSKVVPEAEAKLQAGPFQTNAGRRVQGDQIATQVFRLNFESAANLVPVLRPLISPNNTINANPNNNTLVITDYADNLLRLGKIIAALDGPPNNDLNVVPIHYAIATDIAMMVNRLLETSGTPAADAISVLAYPRTNSVVVRAPSKARADLAKSLIAKLDQPTAQPGNVHVVYLKNACANPARGGVIGQRHSQFNTLNLIIWSLCHSHFLCHPSQCISDRQRYCRIHPGRPNHQHADHHRQRICLPRSAHCHRPARCAPRPGLYRIADRRGGCEQSGRIGRAMGRYVGQRQ